MEAALAAALHGAGRRSAARVRATAAAAAVLLLLAFWAAWIARSRPPAPAPQFSSVAVLPFEAISAGTPDYLVVGITDDMIRGLSRVEGLRVISRSTTFYYRERRRRVTDIALELGVQAVVEGTIAQDGQRVTVGARVVDAREDRTVWSAERIGTIAELPSVRRSLTSALRDRFGPAPRDSGPLPAPSAYEQYLKGRTEWNTRTPAGLNAARQLFEASVAESPLYAEAHAALAATYLLLGAFEVVPKRDVFPRARASADRALAISDEVAEAHAVKGYLLWEEREPDAAFREFRRAIDLDPNNATARQWYALSLVGQDPQEAVRQIRIAHDLDPLSMPVTSDLAVVYRLTGRNADAIAHLTKITRTFPEFPEGHRQLGFALETARRHGEAADAFRRAVSAGADTPENLAAVGYNLAAAGDAHGARVMLQELRQRRRTRAVSWTHDASILCALGDIEGAIASLQRAEREHQEPIQFQTFVGSIEERPPLAVLWNDTRFSRMVRRRLPWMKVASPAASTR
jgi:TolB-like protein/tetratricopeptide (TPR) repeat protein